MKEYFPTQPDPDHEHVHEARERETGMQAVGDGMDALLDLLAERAELPEVLMTSRRAVIDLEGRREQGEDIDENLLATLKDIIIREEAQQRVHNQSDETRP